MKRSEHELQWKVHTPNLLGEIRNNPGTGALRVPLIMFAEILKAVAIRASQLNDPEMNKLMVRLALYAIADPENPAYDPAAVKEVMEKMS